MLPVPPLALIHSLSRDLALLLLLGMLMLMMLGMVMILLLLLLMMLLLLLLLLIAVLEQGASALSGTKVPYYDGKVSS